MRSNTEKFNPLLTQEQFEALHEQCDKARGKFVRVNKQAVEHLLNDHSTLLDIAEIEE